MTGLVIKAISGFFYVKSGDLIYECRARGALRNKEVVPLAGDTVEYTVVDSKSCVIDKVAKRKNDFVRPAIANLDKLFIVSSCHTPAPNQLMIDRIISVAESKGVEPIVVFNKSDLGDFGRLPEIYSQAGFETHIVSCRTGEGIDRIKKSLSGCISAFTGNSGVGKSSIINYIMPELALKTLDVSQKLGRGRHTTREVTLYSCNGGYLADTPGFSSIDIQRYEVILKEDLPNTFREFLKFSNDCCFTQCSHTKEKGCAVLKAVEDGLISESRHKNYCIIYDQIKDIKPWQVKKS